ncbi:MAG: Sec-independent protein translocase protein TatB [Gammaproteobacteria bacterium]|uniref:Sec-independent protein translocase protein TatB n=1 Tax=Rhodoferax sp. TaxID=50421 RepID=UPI001798B821|nr:Sec-independent protein translocase protein TatB [Rhodoferax sp.]MBU3900156.1 Sec-independent protein translocase protein TatB [Gammaproteobacteria bacterium]MBA3058710.1 Sec-independent protein translocase subunit TatB [Rhodoferax sp.]MBU3996692.1 Sec-independent protein translocase protein TatB [Gammaproteobacteria bacterium]MBU4018340.1 Sec-independent protein translocase protein TatB [Gammaproteobacteria bacterium]MBU4082194.1 Sec-independent protein translocase protein TatB [Gammaprote
MIDIGVTKLAIIGGIALIVIGPEKLPGLAKTIGTLLGRARRYVADVKDEVNRSMDLDELKKMKDTVESAVRDVDNGIQTSAADFEKNWTDATAQASNTAANDFSPTPPVYRHPNKKWRVKQGATPNWYKARAGIRTRALSGAARVARFRPHKAQ